MSPHTHPTVTPDALDVDVTADVEALYEDGITARKGAFTPEWADRLREDIETAFEEARSRPGGAVGRGPHRYYVEIHPEQLRGFVDLVDHPWVRSSARRSSAPTTASSRSASTCRSRAPSTSRGTATSRCPRRPAPNGA